MDRKKFITSNRKYDSLDKIRAYYIDGAKLTDIQEKKRLQYEQAHQLRLTGYSKDQTIKLLFKKRLVASKSDGYRVCNNAETLFGDVAASNKEGLRVILSEYLFKIYGKAIKDHNLKEANRALENVAKINSLLSFEDPVKWSEIIIPIPVYTTNSKVLKLHAVNSYEDAELINDD